jgi:peroxiredoxin Q/BCP
MTPSSFAATCLRWASAGLIVSALALSIACSQADPFRMPDVSGGPLLAVGSKAPDFTLSDSKGNAVTLSSFEGRTNVVLVFYPGDDTPVCTQQLCAIRDDFDSYKRANITVFGINPQSAKFHRMFIEKQNYPFELLVDADKAVCTTYGTKGSVKTIRTVYGIDKTGTIVFVERGFPTNRKILAPFKQR